MRNALDRIEARTLLLLVGSLTLPVVAATFSYLLWPQVNAYRSALQSRAVLETLFSGQTDLTRQLAAQEQLVVALRHRLQGDIGGLPSSQMESYIVGRLQKICWRTGMELVGVKPGPARDVREFREIRFDVELAGGYREFFAWLGAVADELGFVTINRYDIRPSGREQDDPRLSIRLTMVSYRVVQS